MTLRTDLETSYEPYEEIVRLAAARRYDEILPSDIDFLIRMTRLAVLLSHPRARERYIMVGVHTKSAFGVWYDASFRGFPDLQSALNFVAELLIEK